MSRDEDELVEHDAHAPADHAEHPWVPSWTAPTAEAIERDIVGYALVPDLADVLARARAMDPAAVPEAWDELARMDHPVVPLAQAPADPTLAAFAADLRGHVEEGLHERTMAGIPEAPALPRRRRAIVAAVMSLAAAIVLAWVVGPRLLGQASTTARDPHSTPSTAPSMAPTPDEHPWERGVTPERSNAKPSSAELPSAEPELPSAELELPSAELELPSAEPPSAELPSAELPRPEAAVRKPATDLDALERDALAAWRSGDLATAERLLLRIAKSGRTLRAELAYADLFAIARQRRGAEGQVAMWRTYLERFPRGRFADDARAGLCRRAEDPTTARLCWERYLERHPAGAHAAEARRWERTPSP